MTKWMTAALAAAAAASLAPASSWAGDSAHGAMVFSTICGTCHSVASPPADIVGPSLFGVVGRKAGTKAGFHYSKAMAAAGFVWTPEQLVQYVGNPQQVVPGNRMPFGGLPNAKDREDVVAYLAQQK